MENKNNEGMRKSKLCKIIKISNMSVPVLARKAGVQTLAIYKILNANGNSSKKFELKLCDALGITWKELNRIA